MKLFKKIPLLEGHIPDYILTQLPDTCTKFNIDGPMRLSHLLGQCAHESANFTVFRENLNYRLESILRVFKSDVDLDNDGVVEQEEIDNAKRYVGNPEMLANFVYANQNGNGPESSGDGWKYRGRGALQTTGRVNYMTLGKFLGVDLIANPDLVATVYPLDSAAYYFNSRGLWSICDQGINDSTILRVTKKVNGGINGLEERIKYTNKFYNILK